MNIRTRLAMLEAGRSPTMQHRLQGLCRRMQEHEQPLTAGELTSDPQRPINPASLAGLMQAQCERNAARQRSEREAGVA